MRVKVHEVTIGADGQVHTWDGYEDVEDDDGLLSACQIKGSERPGEIVCGVQMNKAGEVTHRDVRFLDDMIRETAAGGEGE